MLKMDIGNLQQELKIEITDLRTKNAENIKALEKDIMDRFGNKIDQIYEFANTTVISAKETSERSAAQLEKGIK